MAHLLEGFVAGVVCTCGAGVAVVARKMAQLRPGVFGEIWRRRRAR